MRLSAVGIWIAFAPAPRSLIWILGIGPRLSASRSSAAQRQYSVSNLYLETRYSVIDVLTSVLGVGDFERLNREAEELKVGVRFRVMSFFDLIAAKEVHGREKYLFTAKELRAIAAKRNS